MDEFDAIVKSAIRKSVVTAPSDPNGGAKLPQRQKNQPGNKRRDGENYMAIFDREAQESDDQLEEWEKDTNDTTDSPDKFVNDDDDVAEDPDAEDEDARGNEEYDPFSDDDDADENEDVVKVRAHKRRKSVKKSRGDHDVEDEALSDEDDDDDLDEDDDHKPVKASKTKEVKKSRADEDEEHDAEDCKDRDCPEHGKRRREVKKALGADAANFADASPFAKALTEAVFDIKDEVIQELRVQNLAQRKLIKALAARVEAVEKSLGNDLRSMTKSLAGGLAAVSQPVVVDEGSAPVRKGYGAPVRTAPRAGQPFNWVKAVDLLEKGYQSNDQRIRDTDITLMEGNKTPTALSRGAQEYLQENGLI